MILNFKIFQKIKPKNSKKNFRHDIEDLQQAHTDFKCHFQSKMKKKSKMLWHQLFWVNNLLQTREQSDQKEFVA